MSKNGVFNGVSTYKHSLPPSAVESISQVIDNAVKEEKKRQRGGGNKSRR